MSFLQIKNYTVTGLQTNEPTAIGPIIHRFVHEDVIGKSAESHPKAKVLSPVALPLSTEQIILLQKSTRLVMHDTPFVNPC